MSAQAENSSATPLTVETDWLLQSLVSTANEAGLQIGITLQVSGMLVSGILISGKQYFEGFSNELSAFFIKNPEEANAIKASFSAFDEIYDQRNEEAPDRFDPQYIHLKDARYFNTAGNPIPGNRGLWWRGRICEVGGFTLGNLIVDVS